MSKKNRHRNASELDAVLSPLDTSREKEVKDGLSAIFRDEKGDMPDLATFDRSRSNLWLIVLSTIGGFIVILLVAVWFGFSIFKPFSGFGGKGLKIVIDGPDRVALGQEMTYFINYQDLAAEPLASADIRVSFPPDLLRSISPRSVPTSRVRRR